MGSSNNDDNPLRGLGSVDSKQGTLDLGFDLPSDQNISSQSRKSTGPVTKKKGKIRKESGSLPKTLQIELHQDTTALRSRVGDTGKYLWIILLVKH